MPLISLITMLPLTSCICSVSPWSHLKEFGAWLTEDFLESHHECCAFLLSSHSLSGGFPNFTSQAQEKFPKNLKESRRFSGILCQRATPKPELLSPKPELLSHTTEKTTGGGVSLWLAVHTLSFKVSLEVLAKSMIHGFCEIPGAISWAWLLSAPQSRAELGKTPSSSGGLLRWRVQSHRKQENHTGLQHLEIQPWVLNQLFSVHPRCGSHSVAAVGSMSARHRDRLCHGAAAPSTPTGHEWAAVPSLHVSLALLVPGMCRMDRGATAETASSTYSCSQNINTCKMPGTVSVCASAAVCLGRGWEC